MSNTIGGQLDTMEELISFFKGYSKAEKNNTVNSFLEQMKNTQNQSSINHTKTTSTLYTSYDPKIIQKLLDSLSKDYTNIENLKPEDISFEDYKKLSYKEKNSYGTLKILFNNNKEKLSYASSLMVKSQMFDDDTLNKVYFDKKIENNGKYSTMYDQTLDLISIMWGLVVNVNENGAYIEDPYGSGYIKAGGEIFTTKNKLFSDFNQFEKWYNSHLTQWQGFNIPKTIDTMKEIKAEYEKRVSENNSILNQYTKNSKPNPVESL